MDADERRLAYEERELVLKAALERAKAAAVQAVRSGEAVPDWASDEIKTSIIDRCWEDILWWGVWIAHTEIPDVIEGLDYRYFENVLGPAREKALSEGAKPTEEERRIHRHCFLTDRFEKGGGGDLPFWEVFEVRADSGSCYLLVSRAGGGQGGTWIEHFQFFREADDPFHWLQENGVADRDLCP